MTEERYERTLHLGLDRRSLLRGSALGLGGLAAAALIGCGSDDDDEDSGSTAATATSSAEGTASATPTGIGQLIQDPALPYPYTFPEPATEPKPGGVMRVAATWDVGPMDPTLSAAGGTMTVPNMTYNRLIGIVRGPMADPFNMELEPELADSWERTPDGLTYSFKIHPGIKYQNLAPLDGREFTAEDAAFALNRYATEGVHQQYFSNVESMEAIDASTFVITMKRATADFINPLGSDKLTIFPRELVDDGSIETKLVGTGPMIMTSAAQGDKVVFEKNPDYWRTDVLLDGFEFLIRPDHSARLAAFRAGQIEYGYSVVASLSDVQALEGTNPGIQVNMVPLTYVTFTLSLDLSDPTFQDVRVRRAISMAIDRTSITEIVSEGIGRSLHIAPWTYVMDEEPTIESGNLGNWMRYDPIEAKSLLDAAGVTSLTLNNQYYAYSSTNDRHAEILVPMLKEVGINLTGGKVDYTQFNSQWVGGTLPGVTTSGWGTVGFDADNWFYGQVHSQSPGNRWRLSDPEIDEWAEQQQVELDPAARSEIQRKIWDKDLDMMYRPPLPGSLTFEVYQPWMRGVRWGPASPNSNSSYYNWGSQVEYAWLDR